MKKFKYLILGAIVVSGLFSCTEEWDDHYSQQEAVIENENVEIVNASAADYLRSNASYGKMTEMFDAAEILSSMEKSNLLYTVFVVSDESFEIGENTTDETFLSRAHVTTASVSPSNMKDGQRFVMWNGKYVLVNKTPQSEGKEDQISLNGSRVKKVIKTNNGYIYELESLIETPMSLLELLESLGDDYSTFKEMVLSKNTLAFDREASTQIGIDPSGNTLYDSVFVVRNPYFLQSGVDLSSESASFTMLIPSNDLIRNAFTKARATVDEWDVQREDSIFMNWCFQVAFFKEKYDRSFFENPDPTKIDLTSAFGKQWRTTVNKVDLDNPIPMSNGIAYYMTELKIPQNVLIWRFKEYFKWYERLTAQDKDKYFTLINEVFERTEAETTSWSPGPGWPAVDNTSVRFRLVNQDLHDATIDYTAFLFESNPNGTYEAKPFLLPPGEYSFHFGIGYGSRSKSKMDIFLNNELVRSLEIAELAGFTRDRSGGGGPEFFTGASTYDRDGGQVAIITIEGDKPMPIRLTFHMYDHETTQINMHHWCFRPTANCY